MDIRVISIGTLAANPLWNEKPGAAVRSGHATTTLVRSGKRTILIDPGLPAAALAARLAERTGIHAGEVTHVFLTAFKPDILSAAFSRSAISASSVLSMPSISSRIVSIGDLGGL